MHIHLRERRISFDGATLKTRSKELVRFVGYLAWRFREHGAPEWVGMEEMRGVVGSAEPKQYSRYLDRLEESGLAVVEFRHKTKGPWRLSGKVKQIEFDVCDSEVELEFPVRQKQQAFQNDDNLLFSIATTLTEADAFFHNGNLSDSLRAARSLLFGEKGIGEDVELQVLIQMRVARTCARASFFEEASAALDAARQILKAQRVTYPDLNIKIDLAKAKLLFDRGKFAQASAVLENLPMHECRDMQTQAQFHNLYGLFIHRRLRLDVEAGVRLDPAMAREWVQSSITHYRRSMVSHLFLNDYHGVQAVCFNLGNLFVFSRKHHFISENNVSQEYAIRWIALSEIICNKQGVGGESVWALLLLVDTALADELPIKRLQELTGNLFSRFNAYGEIVAWIHGESLRIGNRMEIAKSLQLISKIAVLKGDDSGARKSAHQSLDMLNDMGRKDLARAMKPLTVSGGG